MKISLEDVKKNLRWIVCAFLGLFHFILLSFPYASAFASYGKEKESMGFSGYAIMGDDFSEADAGFIASFFQTLTLICAVFLLILGAYILVNKFFGEIIKKTANIDLPLEFGAFKVKNVCNLTLFIYGVLNILVFLSILIVCMSNSQSAFGIKVGISPSIGIFFALLLSIGGFFGLRYVEKKIPGFTDMPLKKYACEKCGEPSATGVSFCTKCGGKIVEIIPVPAPEYVCEACKAPSKPGVAFCSKCGGKIVEIVPDPAKEISYVCDKCGAPSKEGAKFCTKCGGNIITK